MSRGETSCGSSEFDGEILAGFGDRFHKAKSLKISKSGVEIVGGHRAAMAGAALGPQIFQVAVMCGNDLMERGDGMIEGGRASTNIGATSDPRRGDASLEHRGTHWARGKHVADVPGDSGKPIRPRGSNAAEEFNDGNATSNDEEKNECQQATDDKKDAFWQRTTGRGFGHGCLLAPGFCGCGHSCEALQDRGRC